MFETGQIKLIPSYQEVFLVFFTSRTFYEFGCCLTMTQRVKTTQKRDPSLTFNPRVVLIGFQPTRAWCFEFKQKQKRLLLKMFLQSTPPCGCFLDEEE